MIQHATIFWVAVAGLFLTALTVVGSEVRDRDQRLVELQSAIERELETIHVLKAERAYLSRPEHVAERAREELGFEEFEASRIIRFADLPRWTPTPKLEIRPEGIPPLLLSSAEGLDGDFGAVAHDLAPVLSTVRLETARILHETAWTISDAEPAAE